MLSPAAAKQGPAGKDEVFQDPHRFSGREQEGVVKIEIYTETSLKKGWLRMKQKPPILHHDILNLDLFVAAGKKMQAIQLWPVEQGVGFVVSSHPYHHKRRTNTLFVNQNSSLPLKF